MTDAATNVLNLESYRRTSVAAPRGAEAAAAPVTNYGAMSADPFAMPMAFLTAWPTFIFWPCAAPPRVGGGRDGAEQAG